MTTTDGLTRGMRVIDTGAPLSVPIGGDTLRKNFNVLGEPVDNLGPVDARMVPNQIWNWSWPRHGIGYRYPTNGSFSIMNGIEYMTGNRYLGHQLGFLVRAMSLERDLQLELKLSKLY